MTEESFAKLVEIEDCAKHDRAAAVGGRDELLRQIKEEFGVKTLEQLQALGKKERKRRDALLQDEDDEAKEFRKKWPDQMKEIDDVRK